MISPGLIPAFSEGLPGAVRSTIKRPYNSSLRQIIEKCDKIPCLVFFYDGICNIFPHGAGALDVLPGKSYNSIGVMLLHTGAMELNGKPCSFPQQQMS